MSQTQSQQPADEVRVTPRPYREEQAWQEIGQTEFAPGMPKSHRHRLPRIFTHRAHAAAVVAIRRVRGVSQADDTTVVEGIAGTA